MIHNQFEPALPSRYVVGVDLGTTNSAVNFVDTSEVPWRVRVFSIPQFVATAQVEARETLPSFHFEPTSSGDAGSGPELAWHTEAPGYIVGLMAREQASANAARVIASAKSWLSHAGVDRTAAILPWQAAEDVTKISPVEASCRFLRHLRCAWDDEFPEFPLADQDVVLTLPASFDEIARELTVEAARMAGLPNVLLIEEPQAAFYAWVDGHREDWHERVHPGQTILVCDVGGGTSDFTLIRVRRRDADVAGTEANVQFHRVAVGEHLILGGDNLDLALAHHVEQQHFQDTPLQPRQWDVLVRQARRAKETLLGDEAPEEYTIHLPGRGSSLIGQGMRATVRQDEVSDILLNGFFPMNELEDEPASTQSGFQEFSLPYAKDPAITRYLAEFLRTHAFSGRDAAPTDARSAARPDLVLFNGGLFAAPKVRHRMVDVLRHWFACNGQADWEPQLIQNPRLDQAVAHGAAYYGMVRRGEGVRIAAGLARSYYLGVHAATPSAVCLVPGTAEPGDSIRLSKPELDLRISEPAEFPLYVSSTRLADEPGQIIEIDAEHMKPLPPIRTALRSGKSRKAEVVTVQLQADLTEIGTLELWCVAASDDRRWRLQFDVRSATATDVAAVNTVGEQQGVADESSWTALEKILQQTFGPSRIQEPSALMPSLIQASNLDRWDWPMPMLRRIWETLMELRDGRKFSAQHEARWLNLVGFSLRPGYGMAVDDWRVTETWRHTHGKLVFSAPACRNEFWILWRRVSGGLPAGQQRALAEPYLASIRGLHKRMSGRGGRGDAGFQPQQAGEAFRLLGSLEWLSSSVKRELGSVFLDWRERKKLESVRGALTWAVGRLGGRVPLYGPLNTALSAADAEDWLRRLIESSCPPQGQDWVAVMQLARQTGDRQRDVDPKLREQVCDWMRRQGAPELMLPPLRSVADLDVSTQNQLFGDALPPGLSLRT